jgi:FeS assembly SUF system protein
MGTKGLWQSVTGWMGKSAGVPAAEASPGAAVSPTQAVDEARAFEQPPPDPNPQSGPQDSPPAAPAAGPPEPARENTEIEKKVIEIIKTCYDPEIPVNIYELGLIYDVKVDEQQAHVKMTLTAPNCPAAQSLPAEVKHKIEAMDEINTANVEIVFEPPWHPNNMSDSAKLVLNIL